jgi:uroporphyrinogen-III decarboxylase
MTAPRHKQAEAAAGRRNDGFTLLDPALLLGPQEGVRRAAREAIERTGGVGHILNLGHGILRTTPVENARAFVEAGQAVALRARVPVERAR